LFKLFKRYRGNKTDERVNLKAMSSPTLPGDDRRRHKTVRQLTRCMEYRVLGSCVLWWTIDL